ncbi:uncharacterized protein PHALS_09055 [Plasmopara halstedii]|uniref:Uncharacterized protein n=1 Tax=Plasmopara halstedii TaxID=4781 RepID=A0A0P1AEN8_PLAHL|nr:uncharacterized protein PHALS_09055 [Plasmopara halstedii]CEG38990.1 hypothetical protein PHALS_09055 [Plasmopara halstedii]|eukprot:XP_024575359.1 hypothetical protein PHALS_09055 [Plasmopara halstedii]
MSHYFHISPVAFQACGEKVYKLANGLRVVVQEDGSIPTGCLEASETVKAIE